MAQEDERDEKEKTDDLSHYPVVDDNGNTIGYVDMRVLMVELNNRTAVVDHFKQEVQQLRNQVLRIQNQVRAMETKMARR